MKKISYFKLLHLVRYGKQPVIIKLCIGDMVAYYYYDSKLKNYKLLSSNNECIVFKNFLNETITYCDAFYKWIIKVI